MQRIHAIYRIETCGDLRKAAESIAGEQSSGTFVEVPGESAELRERFRARLESLTELGTTSSPSLPGCRETGKEYKQAEIVVSWSVENFGYNLPTIISTLQGNLYELSQLSGLKLMDIQLPDSFKNHYKGPAFGISGTRELTSVSGRPLIGTIIKPSIGMSPADTAQLVETLVTAGIDFIKDDELMANPPHSPFDQRVDAIMRVICSHAERTGKKVMYAFNISDEYDAMQRHYDKVVSAGGTCAMVSLNTVGLSATKSICDRRQLAIHGHRNGWGMLNRHPMLGMDFSAYQKLWRLAGVDQIHVNGIANKFWEPDDLVVHSIQSCQKPLLGGYHILPVVSSGQWGGQAPETWRRTHTIDLLYMAGGGIVAHPGGPADGVLALRDAWEGAVQGLSIQQIAQQSKPFAQAMGKFQK